MAGLYRPRMYAQIGVPTVGQPQTRVAQEKTDDSFFIDVRPTRARLTSNNYNEADELELTLTYDDAGIDPRFLKSANIAFFLGDAADDGSFTPSMDNLRFTGIAVTIDREFNRQGRFVTLRALDYTTLFIETRGKFPAAGIPDFSQTLRSAWERICDHTGYWDTSDISHSTVKSTVQNLKGNLDLINVPESTTLGRAVPARIAALGKLQVPHKADAWAVWRTAVESLGLITFIRGDRCVVMNGSDFYVLDDPPLFINGKNVVELKESREAKDGKGVCMRSFDPLKGRTLEAFFPPPEQHARTKRMGANANQESVAILAKEFDFLESPFPCADQGTLQTIAQRVYEERSRQELSGRMKVVDMAVDTVSGNNFDVLKLQAGDAINVQIDRESLGTIQSLETTGERASRLRDLGYGDQLVQFIVSNLDAIVRMPPQFHVKTVETVFELPSGSGGALTYETTIAFVNRIHIDGSAVAKGPGKRVSAMKDQNDRAGDHTIGTGKQSDSGGFDGDVPKTKAKPGGRPGAPPTPGDILRGGKSTTPINEILK